MDWIDLIWHGMAGACATLCGVYLVVWTRRRTEFEHLSVALASGAVATMAVIERAVLHVTDPDLFATLVRWFHVPMLVLLVALVVFARLRYGVGSLWLASAAIGSRLVSLVANFTTGVNVNFLSVSDLRPLHLGGDVVMSPVGEANPWMAVAQASLVFTVWYLGHAALQLRRRDGSDDNRRGVAILLSIIAFLVVAGGWSLSVATGVSHLPFLVVPLFACVVLALSYDLGGQLHRVPELSRSLVDSEEGRRSGEAQLEVVGRATGLGTWSWDLRNNEVECSERALELLDFGPGEGFDRDRLLERADRTLLATGGADLETALSGNGEFRHAMRVRLRNGGERWLDAVGLVERDPSGKPLRVRGVLLDGTSRRVADERFRRVVEAAPTAMLLVQADGRITFANERAEHTFGYSRAELYGMTVDALVPQGWRGRHPGLRGGYGSQPTSRHMSGLREICGRRKDGSEVPLEITLSPMPAEQGERVLAVINDISARKLAEKDAALRRSELAHLSRVALLAELSGSLAHELNQPLTSILSNAQAGSRFLARDPPDLDEVRESLRNIIDSDKRAGEVIRRMRAMLRNEPPDVQRLDLNEVIEDVLHILHSDLITRDVEARLELATALPPILGDRVQLQQVVMNLVINACDAMAGEAEQRQLRISTRESIDGKVELVVVDHGTGIPAPDLERIFSPFVTSKRTGLGLGLAVCASIVQAHHGRLWAENNEGRGATLHLELPPEPAAPT